MLRSILRKAHVTTRSLFQQRAASSSSGSNSELNENTVSVWLGGLFGQGEPVTYAGVTIHKPSKFNYWMGEFVGAQLWFAKMF